MVVTTDELKAQIRLARVRLNKARHEFTAATKVMQRLRDRCPHPSDKRDAVRDGMVTNVLCGLCGADLTWTPHNRDRRPMRKQRS